MDEGLVEINKKLDAIMSHLGVKEVSKDEYLGMSDDDKDKKDAKDVQPKKSEE